MCLIIFAWKVNPAYPLALISNRDEFYGRPTSTADWWEDEVNIWAGRDLEAKGTWMGVNREGYFAAITNYREPLNMIQNAPSRGQLVTNFLKYRPSPSEYLKELKEIGSQFNGFNLIFGHQDQLSYYSNRGAESENLAPGIYGLSNHLLDTPWPKVSRGKDGLGRLIQKKSGIISKEEAFSLLNNTEQALDNQLPDTGIGLEWERKLSPIFIEGQKYGTRTSTLFLINNEQVWDLEERTKEGDQVNRIRFSPNSKA